MVKTIEVDATLSILNKIESSGLPCRMKDGIMIVTINTDSTEELLKFGQALSGAKRITYRCIDAQKATTPTPTGISIKE
jgi:hypothetical protein